MDNLHDCLKTLEPSRIELTTVYYDDKIYRHFKDRLCPIMRNAGSLRQLANYGAILYETCKPTHSPNEVKVAIVINPPYVYICPSFDGLDGVFIDSYKPEIYGQCAVRFTKINEDESSKDNPKFDDTLHLYSDYYARLDGWDVTAKMIDLARQQNNESR